MQVMGKESLSDVDLTRTYRVVSTAAVLTSPSAFAIWGNETVSKAQSTPYEGMLDAVEQSLAGGMQPEPVTEDSIVASKGPPPLNPECVVCNAGSGVQVDDTNASSSGRPICTPCPAGSYSTGGKAAECQLCPPGADSALVLLCLPGNSYPVCRILRK